MKKRMKQIVAIGLTFSMLMSMTACKGEGENKTTKTTAKMNKEYVFKESFLKDMGIDLKITDCSGIDVVGDRIYMKSYVEEEKGNHEIVLSFQKDGSDLRTFDLPSGSVYGDDNNEAIEVNPDDMIQPRSEDLETETSKEIVIEDTVRSLNLDASETTDVSTNGESDEKQDLDMNSETEASDEEAKKTDDSEPAVMDMQIDKGYSSTDYSNFSVGNDGTIYLLKNKYEESNENGEYTYSNSTFLNAFDMDGNLLSEKEIKSFTENEDNYFNCVLVDSDRECIYFVDGGNSQNIYITDMDINLISTVTVTKSAFINQLFLSGKKLIAQGYDADYNKQYLAILDADTKKITNEVDVTFLNRYSFYEGNDKVDLYLSNNDGLYKWNEGEESPKKLLDFIDSDLNTSSFNQVKAIDDEHFIACYSDTVNWTAVTAMLTKVDPATIKDKQPLTLACHYIDDTIRAQVINFNKASETARIQVVDYSVYDGNDEATYDAGVTKMNNEIAGGNVPDIFVLNTQLPVKSYLAKGLFADLNPYLEKDTEFKKEDYLENIIDAYSVDGKWYIMVPSFDVETLVAKKSLVGDRKTWTLDDVNEILSKMPEGAKFIEDGTRMSIMTQILSASGSEFIDWSKGQCYFNTDEFAKLLDFVKDYPETIEYSDEYWENYDSFYQQMYREDKVLAATIGIYNMSDLRYVMRARFGETIAYMGYPNSKGITGIINPNLQLAISSKCKNADAAWEFVRYFLSDEYQNKDNMYALPISKKAIDENAAKAMKNPTYEDENGNLVEYPETYYSDGNEIVMEPLTQEEVDTLKEYIFGLNTAYGFDDTAITIIMEEADSFFKGQKSVKEVSDVIQSRVQIYVNENR